MAPKPLTSDKKAPASADDAETAELEKKLVAPNPAAVRVVGDTPGSMPPSEDEDDDDEEDDDELELELGDDEDDEDLVVFTAKEAAGALATIYRFVTPYLS